MGKDSFDLAPFCMRARTFVEQGRMEDALALYGDVLQVDPDNALAHADRGTAYAMMKKFDFALRDIERAFELGYAQASTYCTAGAIHFEQKQLEKALECFAMAIKLDQTYAFAYYNRSNVLHALGDNRGAITDLQTCLQYQPDESMKQLVLRRIKLLRALH